MTKQALSRLILIAALIITAHSFKPISGRSVAEQLFSAIESLSFVVPDSAQVRIAQASFLAAAFGRSLQSEENSSPQRADQATGSSAASSPAALAAERDAVDADYPAKAKQTVMRSTLPAALAKARLRIRPLIPDLPEVRPLEHALTISLPQADVELVAAPLPRIRRVRLPMRYFVSPILLKPMLSFHPVIKSDCDNSIPTDILAAVEAELALVEGPEEEQQAATEKEKVLPEEGATAIREKVVAIEPEPGPSTVSPRKCETQLPEPAPPPPMNIFEPKQ